MKVAVFGASTPLGARVARDLSETPEVEVVRDPIDLSDIDVAVGCFDNDSWSEVASARVCIDSGIGYISSSDDIETFEALLALDEQAAAKSTFVLAGVGWAPGISNVMCSAAIEKADEVKRIRIAWSASGSGVWGNTGLEKVMASQMGPVAIFEDGSWGRARPGGKVEEVFFPEPVGWRKVRAAGSAEVLSLPKNFSGVQTVSVKTSVAEPLLDAAVAILLSKVERKPNLQQKALRFLSATPFARDSGISKFGWTALRVDVWTITGGKSETVTMGVVDQLPNLMAAPIVVAALMAATGQIKGAGSFAPESVIPPKPFFDALATRGVKVATLQRRS